MPRAHRPDGGQSCTNIGTLIVGLDFGTTYSGAAWAHSIGDPASSEPRVHLVTRWPNKTSAAKAPTQLAYNTTEPSSRFSVEDEGILWGYGIPEDKLRASWFKFLLLDHSDLSPELQSSKQLRAAKKFLPGFRENSAKKLVSHYLQVLWEHVLSCIIRSAGRETVESSKIKVIITTPAMWPHYAQKRMATAAEAAGITRTNGQTSVTFMSEPEAAALANFYDDRSFMQSQLSFGDSFVMCDAGGGTVDLISYRIISHSTDSLTLEEVVPGDGKLCGAFLLDEAFDKLVRSHFGAAWNIAQPHERQNVMQNAWEASIKPEFDGEDTLVSLKVQVPMCCRSHVRINAHWRDSLLDPPHALYEFTRDEIASVFNPIVDEITDLIAEQMKGVFAKTRKHPKFVILTGGFGQSKYLLRRVQAMREMKNTASVLLGMESDSWSAVSRGAVIQGLTSHLRPSHTVQVSSRVARASYGTLQYERFDSGVHDQRDLAWSDEEGAWVAVDQPVWFLKYGDDITETNAVRFEFYTLYPISKGIPSSHTVSLYHSRDNHAPSRLIPSVQELCTIQWSDCPHPSVEIVENEEGTEHYAVCFDVEMTVRGAGLEFSVIVDGKRVTAKNVDVQYATPASSPAIFRRHSGAADVTPKISRRSVPPRTPLFTKRKLQEDTMTKERPSKRPAGRRSVLDARPWSWS